MQEKEWELFFSVCPSAFQIITNFQEIETPEKSFGTVNSLDSLWMKTGEEEIPAYQAGSPEHLSGNWGIGRV